MLNGPNLQIQPPTPGIPGSGKAYFSLLGGCCSPTASAGNRTGTRVALNLRTRRTTITNLDTGDRRSTCYGLGIDTSPRHPPAI
ncbi:hypothetical protein ACRAWC_22870 [Leifsonia sp. L25]|uniref:hypothetical protein n=1 Tax=Leifsonia sp. L25 TaxID=3423957 RepID=UPI003D69EDA4